MDGGSQRASTLKGKTHEEGIWCCEWRKNEANGTEYIVTGSADNRLKVWKWIDGHLEYSHACENHGLGVISVDINAKGTMIVSSSLDGQIMFWDLLTGKLLNTYEAETTDAWTVAFSPDSKYIACGTMAGSIKMIEVETAKLANAIPLDGKFVYSVAYSPDGTKLAAGANNGIVSICDLQTGTIRPLDGHSMTVRALAFSPDGRLLASCSDDKQVKVYDAHDGRTVITSLNGHKRWVMTVNFSPDMRHLATGSTDQTVRVWDLNAKAELHSFNEHEDQIWSNRYSPCGTKLMSVSDDRSIVVYNCAA